MMKNVDQDPVLWYPNAYERSLTAPKNLKPPSGDQWTTYDWDNAECGTPKPKARPGHGTLFLCWDGSTKPFDIPAVMSAAKELKMCLVGCDGDLSDRSGTSVRDDMFQGMMGGILGREDPPGFALARNPYGRPSYQKQKIPADSERARQKTFLGPKTMDIDPSADVYCNAISDDPWYGPILIAQSRSDVGLAALRKIVSKTPPGKSVLIEHVQKSKAVDDSKKGLSLRIVTGLGDDSIPVEDGSNLLFGDVGGHANSKRELATRFLLFKEGIEVARCHVSYRDGSHSPVIGPTIEMIETAQAHRGNGYLRILYAEVEKHFFELWRLRRMPGKFADGNKFGPAGQPGFVFKATYLIEQPVERRKKKDGDGSPIHDKKFLSECGFQVRDDICTSLSPLGASIASRRPTDEEMLKFVITADLSKRSKDTDQTAFCENCKEQGPADDYQKCSKCLCVSYCNRHCQEEDWPFHKLWCNKSSSSIRKKLIALKLFEEETIEGKTTLCEHTGAVRFDNNERSREIRNGFYEALGIKPGDPRRI